jgi:7,8-dihydropterin-6-yl-methyl-4-(beta-D-ribofuranosyl)aminobenzene 5'-phosphate synthase
LEAVSTIVLSHGHHDHTGGLYHVLCRFVQKRKEEGPRLPLPEVIAHPDILLHRRRAATEKDPGKYLGVPEPALALLQNWPLRLLKKPLYLTEKLLYLGEIPRKYLEAQALLGEIARDGVHEMDRILDDSALVYVSGKEKAQALTIIAGCAHSGIINTVEYAKSVTGVSRIHAVLGGMHMKDASEALKERTLSYFVEQNIEILRGCHCTGHALNEAARQKPLRTGDYLEIA